MKVRARHIRLLVWASVVVFSYLIFVRWQQFTDTSNDATVSPAPLTEHTAIDDNLVRIVTDTLDVIIDLRGGDLVKADVLDYQKNLGSKEPVTLLNNEEADFYVLRSGLAGKNGPDVSGNRPLFTSDKNLYRLEQGEDSLIVELVHQSDSAVQIIKEYEFRANDYLMDVRYKIQNNSATPFTARLFGQIVRTDFTPQEQGSGALGVQSYLGGAFTTPETAYLKVDFEDMLDADLDESVKGGWVAMIQHYFVSAWIPAQHETHKYQTRTTANNKYILGFVDPEFTVASGSSHEVTAAVYVGPKILRRLESIAPNLDLTIDFGWLWFIAIPLFRVLEFIQGQVVNWGLAIILLTCIVKLVFFYPSHISYSSMARMRKLAPQMKTIKERSGSDKHKLQQEMLALYKREKVNPLSGCLPILIQMPVFIALYWMLLESVELRHAPFILWIHDLSALDPYFVMPIIMGATMLGQQFLSPPPPDPTQARVMRLLPIIFTFLFLWFPAGLVLYWITNNTLSILQQWIITKRIQATQ